MKTTDFQLTTTTKLQRIAWLSSKDKQKVFTHLMHLFNEESLLECFNELAGNRAVGIDGVSKEDYGQHLATNLKELVTRLKGMAYRPGAIREVQIPKEGQPGATRPLGISNFEDKLVQKLMHKVIESIYEPLFLDCSYGFRPGRGCHDAIQALRQHLYEKDVATIIDIDLANYFGTIDHKLLLGMIQEKVKDKRLLRYLARMFKAGILSEGQFILSEEGVPQGTICSPILSNLFAHYVLDEWIAQTVKAHCKGQVELFRYCDDAVICCQYSQDAERIRQALVKRLAKYKLRLNEEKTKLVSFSGRAYEQGVKQASFDFLGFTFYWGRSRRGSAMPKLKSSGKRIRSKLKKVNGWAKAVRNKYRLAEIWRRFGQKLEGHIRYYGVSFNIVGLHRFIHRAVRILFKWLNRRSQCKSFTWEQFELFRQRYPLPRVKIWHALY